MPLVPTLLCPREPDGTITCWRGYWLTHAPGCHLYRGHGNLPCPFKKLQAAGVHSRQHVAGIPPRFSGSVVAGITPEALARDTRARDPHQNFIFSATEPIQACRTAAAHASQIVLSTAASVLWLNVGSAEIPVYRNTTDADVMAFQQKVMSVDVLYINELESCSDTRNAVFMFLSRLLTTRFRSMQLTHLVMSNSSAQVVDALLRPHGLLREYSTLLSSDVILVDAPKPDPSTQEYYNESIALCDKHNLNNGDFFHLQQVVDGYKQGTLENRLQKPVVERARALGLLPPDLVVKQPYDSYPAYVDAPLKYVPWEEMGKQP